MLVKCIKPAVGPAIETRTITKENGCRFNHRILFDFAFKFLQVEQLNEMFSTFYVTFIPLFVEK